MADNKSTDDKIFNKIDQDKFKQEVKTEAIAEAKQTLIDNIQGKKSQYSWEERGKNKPDNYDELYSDIKKDRIKPEDVDKMVEDKFKKREEVQIQKAEEVRKQKDEDLKTKRQNFDKDWYSLVEEGKMPAPSKEIQERINKGEQLTKEEIMADDGLKARLELAKYSQNKNAKLAYYEDLNKEQPGKNAPVLGARPSSPQKDAKELTYDDVSKNRKKMFGY